MKYIKSQPTSLTKHTFSVTASDTGSGLPAPRNEGFYKDNYYITKQNLDKQRV